MSTKTILASALAGALIGTSAYAQNVETHIGKIEVEGGYPSKASLDKIIDELDFQRACRGQSWRLHRPDVSAANDFRLRRVPVSLGDERRGPSDARGHHN